MKTCLSFLFLTIFCNAFAQDAVRVKVKDEKGETLQEAIVFNSSTKAHFHGEGNGLISVAAAVGDTLTIRQLAYKSASYVLSKKDFGEILTIRLEEDPFLLNSVHIRPETNALHTLSKVDMNMVSVNSSQDLLRKVPGLFIGQHAGGGKAEQMFLRGFDLDHGTDINISVDGVPVNMVSHAHGQGYSDLHFVIPETVENIDFSKGPYNTAKGDFTTAGYVSFKTKTQLKESKIQTEIGQFNTLRYLALLNLLNNENQQAYVAGELLQTDNYFQASQNFNRLNLMAKYSAALKDHSTLTLTASHFNSDWDASGQIPQRAIDEGLISRWGAIDSTEGGQTDRSQINLQFHKAINANTRYNGNAYFTKYDFSLFSNFTFFLNDPVNGDQIHQNETRTISGFNHEVDYDTHWGEWSLSFQPGLGYRNDKITNIGLAHTKQRDTVLEQIQLGDVNQTNMYAYLNSVFNYRNIEINAGLRLDHFEQAYIDQLMPNYTHLKARTNKVSPKLNVIYSFNPNVQVYLKNGLGFHSNDTRVVLMGTGNETAPSAFGTDLGTLIKAGNRLLINAAMWQMHSKQEFVYVGDEGVVEPSNASQRMGVDLSIRYQANPYLFLYADATYSHARTKDDDGQSIFIPLAPVSTLTGGLSLKDWKGFSGSLALRSLSDRPANDDGSLEAKGYTVTDFNLTYTYLHYYFGLNIQNLFNTAWKETQFDTESRLKNETEGVSEIHFIPGTPFNARLKFGFRF
ncbi:TonB-dependent receptor plug domain-containing protein [Marinilongibacter aquaticus]|uniref:TonB-dependent receptor n=1 Tax=Marinilongibacter aquaticus TaxID=2975157 RepID=UPI0021BD7566|nr:TonB-dependent receptor plug domain-containing protein [Marinilongibacter aquaticus]UBM57853.1 TonB-dependent receptor plug domain-containing protein [Marinilongibacter aquaticus]